MQYLRNAPTPTWIPSLGCPPSDGFPALTRHSLKFWKPCLWAVAQLEPRLLVEPGAWAGSTMEQTSVQRMTASLKTLAASPNSQMSVPTGMSVARSYAAEGLAVTEATVAEVEHCLYRAAREYVRAVGIPMLPRRDSWNHLKQWLQQQQAPAVPLAPARTAPPQIATLAPAQPAPLMLHGPAISPWDGTTQTPEEPAPQLASRAPEPMRSARIKDKTLAALLKASSTTPGDGQ